MEKIRYEIDPFNRLVIADRSSGLPRHRRVLEGQFRIGEGNELEYRTDTPVCEGADEPGRIRLQGRWSLTVNHDLKYTLDASRRGAGRASLTLAGEIIAVKGNSLLFAVTTASSDGRRRTCALELTGSWAADERNRLTFSVRRQSGEADLLRFAAAWSVNRHNELVYSCERVSSSRTAGPRHMLTFKGRWHVTDKAVLSYALEGASSGSFDFRVAPGICSGERLKYEVGIGLARHLRPAVRTVILYGTWRLTRSSGLTFEVEYAGGKVYSMAFAAEARLTDNDKVNFKLRDPAGRKDLGLEVELEHDILKGSGSAFLRLLKSKEESAVLIGAAIRW